MEDPVVALMARGTCDEGQALVLGEMSDDILLR